MADTQSSRKCQKGSFSFLAVFLRVRKVSQLSSPRLERVPKVIFLRVTHSLSLRLQRRNKLIS